jgi:lysophospholipase L1-like esterase
MLFIVGDSTVHNPGRSERGWGDVIGKSFDTNKIRVENHALGGRSRRTFIAGLRELKDCPLVGFLKA